MAGLLNIPKLVDYRNKVKRHPFRKFPVLNLMGKTTIAIHHSLTRQGLGGSNAESYARHHVDTHGWPSIGYSYVIEPDGTIKFCNDIELRTYHVGDHNNYCVGVCLTGDFRYEKPTKAQEESLRNLVRGLQKHYPHLKYVKGHNEFRGYEWKQCPVFDYKKVLAQKGAVSTSSPKPMPLPNTYTIQQGDTLWGIAKGLKSISVDDLIKANPGIKPTQLRVGQVINLGAAKPASKPTAKPIAKPTSKPASKKKLYLPASASSWRIYPTNKAPVKGNEVGYLRPYKFNGLEYEVLANPQKDVYTIQTRDYGKVNIYAAPSTGAKVK